MNEIDPASVVLDHLYLKYTIQEQDRSECCVADTFHHLIKDDRFMCQQSASVGEMLLYAIHILQAVPCNN